MILNKIHIGYEKYEANGYKRALIRVDISISNTPLSLPPPKKEKSLHRWHYYAHHTQHHKMVYSLCKIASVIGTRFVYSKSSL